MSVPTSAAGHCRLAAHATSVIAFEPQRCVFECLSRSIEGFRTIVAHNAAVGSGLGAIRVPDLDIDKPSNFGGVTMAIPHHEQPDRRMLDVPLVTLDGALRGMDVSFIKIDVEGSEAAVIEGARDTIKRCKPILFVEMDHKLTDSDALRESIESMGYATEKRGGNFLGMPL
jgi:FkbM family methyltransferase